MEDLYIALIEEAKEKIMEFKFMQLHTTMQQRARELSWALIDGALKRETSTVFAPFEGYRSPERQRELFNKIPRVTKAVAWRSPHQYGLAVDFVAWTREGWSWDDNHDWQYLKGRAEEFGLEVPITWDPVHVQSPHWRSIQKVWRNAGSFQERLDDTSGYNV